MKEQQHLSVTSDSIEKINLSISCTLMILLVRNLKVPFNNSVATQN